MGLGDFLRSLFEGTGDSNSRAQCATRGCTRPIALNPYTGDPKPPWCGSCRSARKCGIDPSK